MKTREAKAMLQELVRKAPNRLDMQSRKLFEAIMTICDDRDFYKEDNNKLRTSNREFYDQLQALTNEKNGLKTTINKAKILVNEWGDKISPELREEMLNLLNE